MLDGPGDETRTENAVTATGGQLRWNRTVQAWDATGRMTAATVFVNASDTTGRTTSTAYTPADGGPVEQMTITNALGQTTLHQPGLAGHPDVGDRCGGSNNQRYP